MRLPWISQNKSQRGATRRKRSAPLRVRRLERRRVLDAAVTDLVFAPTDVDPSTAVHDSNEGSQITVTSDASGTGPLVYDWQLTQGANVIAVGHNPSFQFTPLDNANYSVTLTVTDGDQTVASHSESLVVHNVRPVLVVASDQSIKEGATLDLSGVGAPPLGLYIDLGLLDTHTATVDWGDGSPIEAPTIFAATGTGTLGGTHTYIGEGMYEVTVSVTDDDGGKDVKSFFVTVTNANPTATLANDGPVDEGSTAVVSFSGQTDPNPADVSAGFRYAYDLDNDGTFDVGDGNYAGSVASDSQVVSAALLADGPATRTVRARIIDVDNGFTDYTTDITVNNVAPQLLNLAADDDTIDEGQTATIKMTIDDPAAGDVFAVDVDWTDGAPVDTIAGLGLASTSGTVGGTTYQWDGQTRQLTVSHLYQDDNPTATTSDTYAVALAVRDEDLGVSPPYQVDVTVGNVRPVLATADNQSIGEGALLNLSAIGGPPLALFVDNGVVDTHTSTVDWGDGSSIETPTLLFAAGTGTLGAAHTYQDNGIYTVTVTVTDDDGGFDTKSFLVTVGSIAPTAVLANSGPVNEGSTATVSFSGQFDPSAADTAAGFRYAYDLDNDGTFDVGDGTYASSVATSSQLVSAALLADGPGTRTVKGRIVDKDGEFTDYTTTITIDNVRPVLVVAANQTVDEGTLLDLSGIGTPSLGLFVDVGILDTHTTTVDWGDGSAIESPTILAAAGAGTLGGTHTYLDNGVYTVTVTVTDDDGGFDTKSFTVTVNNVPPSVDTLSITTPINEGQSATLTGTYSDPGILDTHQLDVDWDGDNIFDQTVTVTGGSFSLSHLYADDNPTGTPSDTFTVHVQLRDNDGDSGLAGVSLTVNNRPPVLIVALPQMVDEGTLLDLSGVGTPPLGLFVDDGKLDSHTATVNWGDGSDIDAPAIFFADGAGALSATHTYADDGVYTVIVTVTDDDGGVATQSFLVTVTNVVPTLVVSPTSPTSIDEGGSVSFDASFTDPGFDNPDNPTTPDTGDPFNESFRYFVDWGDGRDQVPNQSVLDANGMPSTGMFSGSHIYADDGTYTVTVRIADDNMTGNFATGVDGVDFVQMTFQVTVTNVVPTLVVSPTSPTSIDEGGSVSFDASFTDPGFDNPDNPTTPDTGDPFNESFRYFVDWGDGRDQVPNQSVLDANGMPSTGMFSGSHIYADDGTYTVTVRIADDNMTGNFATGVDGVDFVQMTFQVTVTNVVPTLVVSPTSPTSIDEGGSVSFDASFTDPGFDNPDNPTTPDTGDPFNESFRYFVDWGDGRDQVPNQSVLDANGMPSTGMFSGSHIYADDGTYTVTVRIADDNMTGNFATGVDGVDFVQMTFQVTVTNVVPTLTGTTNVQVNEGQLITLGGLGIGLTDPGFDNPLNPTTPSIGDPFTESFLGYTIDWGDGTALDDLTVVGRVSDLVDGPTTASFESLNQLLARMDHVYADNGTYMVTIRLADDNMAAFANPALFADDTGEGTNYVDLAFEIQVNNVAPMLSLPNGNLPSGGQIILESQTISLVNLGVITDPGFNNPNNPLSSPVGSVETFRYWVDWDDDGTFNSADTNAATIDDIGGEIINNIADLTDASFDGSHTYADNGTYTVRVRVADDDMGAFGSLGLFVNGTAGEDYVELTFTIVVTNVPPQLNAFPGGKKLQGDDINKDGLTTIRLSLHDPGYDNSLNQLNSANGGEQYETFTYVVDWGDGTVDAIHLYTEAQPYTVIVKMDGVEKFNGGFNGSPQSVFTLVSGQDNLYDSTVAATLHTFTIDWGDGTVDTVQLLLKDLDATGAPGAPTPGSSQTIVTAAPRVSGGPLVETTASGEVKHTYAGPPDALHPTNDVPIRLTVLDDDGGMDGGLNDPNALILVPNPGIQVIMIAIDTTPDVPRLDLTEQPTTDVFISDAGGLAQLFQVPDVRGGGGEVAATSERYLELRVVYPDGTESEGLKIKDEALADLRAFFKTLPDGRYRIYLVRTENQSERLVIQVDVRRGRVIDVSDDSEGTRDRPPTDEDAAPQAVPLDQNPNLEPVPAEAGQAEQVQATQQDDQRVSLAPPLLVSLSVAALAAEPWSRRVDAALAGGDENAWRRLRRAGRRGRASRRPQFGVIPRMRTAANLDYNKN